MKASVSDDVWATVSTPTARSSRRRRCCSPTSCSPTPTLFDAAGVAVPTGDTMTWDDFAALAKSLTTRRHVRARLGTQVADGDRHEPGPRLRRHLLHAPKATATSITVGDNELAGAAAHPRHGLRRQVARPGVAHPERRGRAARLLRRHVRDVRRRQLHRPADHRDRPRRLQLDRAAGARRAAPAPTRPPTRRRCRCRRRASTSSRPPTFVNYFMDAKNLASVAEGDWLIPSSGAARDAGRRRHERRERLAGRSSPAATAWWPPRSSRRSTTRSGRTRSPPRPCQQYLADQIDLDGLTEPADRRLGTGQSGG